jgi:hypothetical protein
MKKIKIEIEQEIFTTYACDYEKINLDLPARYERWINLLLKNQSESKKIVCVALAYLPDLFNKFKALGYSIRAVTES